MKKTMGRLAGAVLAGALISLAVSPAAMAQDTDPSTVVTTTEAPVPGTTVPSAPSSDAPAPEKPSSDAPASEKPTSDAPSVPSKPEKPSEPTTPASETSSPTSEPTETTPPEPPYEDDTASGVDGAGNAGYLVISCAAGEPTEVYSPFFDLVQGPYQDEVDGRYWVWEVTRHEGVSFDNGTVTAHWKCAGKPAETPVKPGGGAGTGSETTKDKDSQVKYAPKGGVETGFGGMAQA